MSQRFKNTENRFSGNTGEDVEECFKKYETSSNDYKLTPALQLQYLNNLFNGDAKLYFRDKVTPIAALCDVIKQIIMEHYNNATVQHRTRQYLQSITLSFVMEKENCLVNVGLEKVQDIINKFTPLGQPSQRFDSSKLE